MTSNRLSALDAGFLQTEDGDSHISMAIGALAILEGPLPNFSDIRAALDERSARLPRSRQILHTRPLDVGPPHWIHDHAFNIDHHVRRITVSGPGDDAALYRTVADVMERRLDRSRPLWETWIVDGLADARWAILIKVHHCIADGIAAAAMLNEICDDSELTATTISTMPGRSPITDNRPCAPSSPFDVARKALSAAISLTRGLTRAATGAGSIISGVMSAAPQPLTVELTDLRRFSAARVAMRDVELISERFNVTVNDVALGAITDGFRAAMLRRGLIPHARSLRTLVPVSVRSADAIHIPDNRVSVMLPNLPVDKADPIDQLRLVHQRLESAKRGGQRQAGSLAVAAGNLVPYPLMAAAIRVFSRLPQRGVVALATNIRGPQQQMRFMDYRIVELVPVPPIALGLQAGIAIMSYAGDLVFGIIGDFDAQIEVDELARGVENSVGRLLTVAHAAKRSRRLGNLLLLSS